MEGQGVGPSKANFFKGKYEAALEFLERQKKGRNIF